MNRTLNYFSVFTCIFLLLAACKSKNQIEEEKKQKWIQLFNGKDLNDWTIKMTGYPLGENYNNTFRVVDGKLQVNYDQYESFNGEFGHIFYKTEFSNYKLRLEYRFFGDQVKGGPGWAYRNSGVMIHGQAPETMGLNQKFPVSVEVQLLGGNGNDERTTGNVCTPGTHVFLNDILTKTHCMTSDSDTFHGDQWVKLELEVHNDSLISHRINNVEVMLYSKPQYGGEVDFDNDKWQLKAGAPLKNGSISLQSESHSIEFKNIEILNLN